MKKSDLQFEYPEELVATEPQRPPRVLRVSQGRAGEIAFGDVVSQFAAGDVLVVNNTQVLKRRVFAGASEILFLNSRDQGKTWEVLFPSRALKIGDELELPLGRRMRLLQKGRPQLVELDQAVGEDYFEQVGELPLPPYIQKSRGERHNVSQDENWYQTRWAEKPGSFAAPTASLHFSNEDLQNLRERGVLVVQITLHVGLGTFLPVTSEDLNDHEMHEEFYEIPDAAWAQVQAARKAGGKIWALGTTVVRTLETAALSGALRGFSKLLIQPGFRFQVVDRMLTNFHQPESTLLALVCAFSGEENVKKAYQHAIQNRFRLFSYGDLSIWIP